MDTKENGGSRRCRRRLFLRAGNPARAREDARLSPRSRRSVAKSTGAVKACAGKSCHGRALRGSQEATNDSAELRRRQPKKICIDPRRYMTGPTPLLSRYGRDSSQKSSIEKRRSNQPLSEIRSNPRRAAASLRVSLANVNTRRDCRRTSAGRAPS